MGTREKIIHAAIAEFSIYGVKLVTMDQIAGKVGISKKTLYREFRDKRQLVFDTFSWMLAENAAALEKLEQYAEGIIDHIIAFSEIIRERFADVHPLVLHEIKRSYPDSWALFERFKEEELVKKLIELIEQGKELGYFRPEVNSRILATMRLEQLSNLFDPSKFNPAKVNMDETQLQLFEHFLYGIFSEEGRRVYQEHLNHQL